jgi:hypothetical protein
MNFVQQSPTRARRCGGRRKRIGVGDCPLAARPQRLQRGLAQTLWVALTGLGLFDDDPGDSVTSLGRPAHRLGLEGDHGALQSDAHETYGLWVESLTGQVEPYWHCGGNVLKTFSL